MPTGCSTASKAGRKPSRAAGASGATWRRSRPRMSSISSRDGSRAMPGSASPTTRRRRPSPGSTKSRLRSMPSARVFGRRSRDHGAGARNPQEDAEDAAERPRIGATTEEGRNMKPRDELEELFDEKGQLEELRSRVRKAVLSDQLRAAMKTNNVSPSEMARRMKTSRQVVYRLLDPDDPGATLDTLTRASSALGLELEIRFVPPPARKKPRRVPRGRTSRKAA